MNLVRVYVEFTNEDQVEPLCEAIADVLIEHGFGPDGDSMRSLISVKNTPVALEGTESLAELAMDDSGFILLVGAADESGGDGDAA